MKIRVIKLVVVVGLIGAVSFVAAKITKPRKMKGYLLAQTETSRLGRINQRLVQVKAVAQNYINIYNHETLEVWEMFYKSMQNSVLNPLGIIKNNYHSIANDDTQSLNTINNAHLGVNRTVELIKAVYKIVFDLLKKTFAIKISTFDDSIEEIFESLELIDDCNGFLDVYFRDKVFLKSKVLSFKTELLNIEKNKSIEFVQKLKKKILNKSDHGPLLSDMLDRFNYFIKNETDKYDLVKLGKSIEIIKQLQKNLK